MKAIINFLILFFCININIIFTTCYPHRRWNKNYEPVENWLDNYVFTGIWQQCEWHFTSDYTLNMTWGDTITITDPPAHILQPDTFFGYNSGGPPFNYERVECQFDVEAPVDHGLVVSIQQMNFNKKCTDFVQLTNQDGSLNKTICNKIGGSVPRSYSGSEYLGELNLNKKNHDSSRWDVFDAEGRIHVKISVTNKNFENLRYLFIAFTAIKRDPSTDNDDNTEYFYLPRKYFCDGIKNWKTFKDEKYCASNLNEASALILIFVFVGVMAFITAKCNNREGHVVPVQPLTNTAELVDTPSVNLDINNNRDRELPTYEALFPEKFQQVPNTSPR